MGSSWAESALSWWQEAGVDTLIAEAPRDWLAPMAKAQAAAPEMPPAPADAPPADLDAFRAWFGDGALLPLGAPGAPRLRPSGDPGAGLMILIDMPGPDDVAAGTLLSGTPGALFDRMLAAIGLSRETIYLASMSPFRTPTGTLDAGTAERLAGIARHHIGLAAPRALLLFGDACSKALVGPAVAGARGRWHEIDTAAGAIRTLVTIRPEKLDKQPALKAHAWADLQLLMEELKP
jgi:uracil-DNA glycosylase family 4